MSKLNKSAKKIKLPTDKSERQAVLKQRRLALARQTALSQKRPIRHTRNSVSEPPEDPIQTQTKSEGEKMETEEAGKHVTFRNTLARNGYQTDENVDKPESSAVEPSKPKRNWRKPAGPTESHVKPASLRRPSGNPPCQSAGAKKNSSRKPNVPGPVKRSALLIAAAAATSTKKKILPEQKNKKKRAAASAIDQDICHLCDLAVCPLEQLDEGEDEWVGCTTCPRWFHVGCLLPPDSEAAEYFNPDTFRCKFCAN